MERGGFQRRRPRSSSEAMQVQDANSNGNRARPPCSAREQDQFMPIANVIRIMRRILPPHAKISDDAKETVQECVSEYISFITGEANDRCQREQRKTITAEDLLWAMGKLGFDNYIEPLTLFLNRYREVESDRTALRGEPYVKRTVDFPMPLGVAAQPPYFPPSAAAAAFIVGQHHPAGGMFDGGAMVGYYSRDASGASGGGSSSSHGAAMGSFNPYAPYK